MGGCTTNASVVKNSGGAAVGRGNGEPGAQFGLDELGRQAPAGAMLDLNDVVSAHRSPLLLLRI
jgi:hypothetical protein